MALFAAYLYTCTWSITLAVKLNTDPIIAVDTGMQDSLQLDHGHGVEMKIKEDGRHHAVLGCNAKYPEEALQHMQDSFLSNLGGGGGGKVFIASNMHQNKPILDDWIGAVDHFIDRLGAQNVFVSVVEDGSTDGTAEQLESWKDSLRTRSVQHAISTRVALANPVFHDGDPSTGNRITFLAKLRNAALEPLYDMMHNSGQAGFEKVVFLNDVHLCEGDIWRLVAFQADMTCAMDFNGGMFWDNWVHEGRKMPPSCYKMESKDSCSAETPMEVRCCWNGAVAIDAKAFLQGVRFRRGGSNEADGECQASECSNICRDMYRIGMRKIVADPGVQVAYQMQGLGFRRPLSHQSLFDDRKTFLSDPAGKDKWKCCPLPKDGKRYIDWKQCHWQDMSAFSGKGLPYPAGQQEQYAAHWNWEGAT